MFINIKYEARFILLHGSQSSAARVAGAPAYNQKFLLQTHSYPFQSLTVSNGRPLYLDKLRLLVVRLRLRILFQEEISFHNTFQVLYPCTRNNIFLGSWLRPDSIGGCS
jgi:hypothetical protein